MERKVRGEETGTERREEHQSSSLCVVIWAAVYFKDDKTQLNCKKVCRRGLLQMSAYPEQHLN